MHHVFTALDCGKIFGTLKQIDAGSGSVVGVNNKNEVFVLNDNVFTKIFTSLKHFSVGPAGQFGVDTANNIFKVRGGSLVQIEGEELDCEERKIINIINYKA